MAMVKGRKSSAWEIFMMEIECADRGAGVIVLYSGCKYPSGASERFNISVTSWLLHIPHSRPSMPYTGSAYAGYFMHPRRCTRRR